MTRKLSDLTPQQADAQRAAQHQRYLDHRDLWLAQCKAAQKRRWEADPEGMCRKAREYHQHRSPEQLQARRDWQHDYYMQNREQILQRKHDYYMRNRDRILQRNAAKKLKAILEAIPK